MDTTNNHITDTTHNAGGSSRTLQASPSSSRGVTKFGSSPSLAMACELIACFYCTTADRVRLEGVPAADAPKEWRVFLGDRLIDTVQVVKARGRFVFQSKAY